MVNNKKILIIKLQPYNSLSSSNMRMLAMMKGLDNLGYSMDLLCTPISAVTYVNDMSDYAFLERVRIINTPQNIAYEKLVAKSSNNRRNSIKKFILSVLRKIFHKFSLYTGSVRIARKLSIKILPQNDYEYVISVSDPKISQVALLSLVKQGLKYDHIIEYWGDPLTGDITQKAIYPQFILKKEEEKYFAIADKIIYTSPFTLDFEKKIHPKYSNRMSFVPTANAYPKHFPKNDNDIFTVGYYGAYNSWIRNIIPLYDSFDLLRGKAKLYIVGDSDLELSEKSNITIRSRSVVKDLEAKTDLFVCVLNKSGTQIPGKLYHNAASNKPILVILDGDEPTKMKEYLDSFNRFIICNNNSKSIASAIESIIDDCREWLPCERLEAEVVASEILKD